MFKKTSKLDENFVEQMRELLEQQPARKPAAVKQGKARFLAQASTIQKSPVTQTPIQRHSKWIFSTLKEVKMGTLVTILVIVGLALGGTSAVYAAQDDLPGDPLYQVKLISEGARLELTADPEKKMDLDLQFALRRLDEIEKLIEAGEEPPEMSFARLENQLMHAVGQATLLDEEEVPGALLRIRMTIQERIRVSESELETPLQTRLRTLLQTRLSWLDEGIVDPERFTNEARNGWDTETTEEPGTIPDEEKPGQGYQTPGPGYKTPGPGHKTPSLGQQTPEPGYQTPGPGYQTPGPGNQIPEPGEQTTESGKNNSGKGNNPNNSGSNGSKKP